MFNTAQTPSTRFTGPGEFRGETSGFGVMLQLVANASELKHPDTKLEKARKKPAPPKKKEDSEDKAKDETPRDKVTVEVRDTTGNVIRTFQRDVHLGLNRIYWRFERDGVQGPNRAFQKKPKTPPGGRSVLSGSYSLTVHFQGESQQVTAEVLDDPRVSIPRADQVAKDTLRANRETLNVRLHEVTQHFSPIKKQIDVVRARLAIEEKPEDDDDPLKAIRDALKAIDKAHKAVDEKLWGKENRVQGISRGNDGLMSKARGLMRISGSNDKPNKTEREAMAKAADKVAEIEQVVDGFFADPLPEFRKAVAASTLTLLPAVEPGANKK